MQSFSRGWSFLKQAWQMAFKDRDLIKPSIYSLFVGLFVSVIFLIPIIGSAFIFGDQSLVGRVVIFVFGALLVFAQYSVGYIFSAMTIYLVYGFLAEGDGVMSKAWAIVRREWLNILSLAAASTAVNLLKSAIRGKGRNAGRNILSGLIDTVWTEAAFLILPAMVIEDINLKNALQRAGSIIKNNLLLVGHQHRRCEDRQRSDRFSVGRGRHRPGSRFRAGDYFPDQQFGSRNLRNGDRYRPGGCPGRHLYHGGHGCDQLHVHSLPHLSLPVGPRCGKGPGKREPRPGAGTRSTGGGFE